MPNLLQKLPSRGVLSKRCSEIMQQIYRRAPMLKFDFNKVTKEITLGHGCSPAAYFQNAFSYKHLWMAPSAGSIDGLKKAILQGL